MNQEKIILESDPEAATYKTGLEGWVSRDGYFYGKDEHFARYQGSTHKKCEKCGGIYVKNAYCRLCWEKRQDEKYAAMEQVEWDCESPICTFDDKYFFCGIEEVQDYCEEHGCTVENLKLCHCEPVPYPTIDIDDFFQDMLDSDDCDRDARAVIPQDIQYKIEELNELLKTAEPVSWQCSDKAVRLK